MCKLKYKYIGINASQMIEETKYMNKNEFVILDVRTKQEFEKENILDSILISLDDLKKNAEQCIRMSVEAKHITDF